MVYFSQKKGIGVSYTSVLNVKLYEQLSASQLIFHYVMLNVDADEYARMFYCLESSTSDKRGAMIRSS